MTNPDPYQAVLALFRDYPQAVVPDGGDGRARRMTVTAVAGPGGFWQLRHDARGPEPHCTISPAAVGHRAQDDRVAVIRPGGPGLPGRCAAALAAAVPLPRPGSVSGWCHNGEFTAVVLSSADAVGCLLLVRAGLPGDRWPRVPGGRGSGFPAAWFWDQARARRMMLLDALLAEHPGTVRWLPPRPPRTPPLLAVTAPIRPGRAAYRLPAGVFTAWEAIEGGLPVPSDPADVATSAGAVSLPRVLPRATAERPGDPRPGSTLAAACGKQ